MVSRSPLARSAPPASASAARITSSGAPVGRDVVAQRELEVDEVLEHRRHLRAPRGRAPTTSAADRRSRSNRTWCRTGGTATWRASSCRRRSGRRWPSKCRPGSSGRSRRARRRPPSVVGERHIAEPDLLGARRRASSIPRPSAPRADRRLDTGQARRPGAAAPSIAQFKPAEGDRRHTDRGLDEHHDSGRRQRRRRPHRRRAARRRSTLATEHDRQARQHRLLAQPGRLVLQVVQPAAGGDESIGHPAGETEEAQLLRRGGVDGQPVGVLGVPLRFAHLVGVAVLPHAALAEQPVRRQPRRRRAAAPPTSGSRPAGSPR